MTPLVAPGHASGNEEVFHAAGSDEEVCRVYQKTEPLFSIPCNSRLVGIHKANSRWSSMKVLSLLET